MTKINRQSYVLLLVISMAISDNAIAGKWMDYIRNYDLNDYAFGVSISGNQNPYVGGESSTIAYPVLTSFRDSAFTKDWFLIRDGDVGIRWVSESEWEFGLVGRIETLGFGTSKAPELIGLNDREWGLEIAPIVGYRGWPVHINFKTFTEVTGNHDGWISELAFTLPREAEWGYLVPGIGVIHQTEDYTNYYYGVSPAESNPLRPAYHAEGALNTAVFLRWGYALTDKWLVYGSVDMEFLDSEITASPIVDRDEMLSVSIGIAYNNNIFQSRTSDRPAPNQAKFEIRAGAFRDSIDTKIVRDSSAGNIGSEIDLENLLGLPDEDTLLHVDAIYRVARYHRFELGYLATSRSGQRMLQGELNYGDAQFSAGTTLDSHFDTEIFRIGYAYSIFNDAQKELGVMGGLHFAKFTTDISIAGSGEGETTNASTPLPVIGLHGSVALGEKSKLEARIQLFRMDFARYEGSLNFATLGWQRQFGNTLSAGLAYNYYALKLDSLDSNVRGSLEVRHHGPELFLVLGF